MKLLWFTWKDRKNPQAGGAELVTEEIARRLVGGGHEVIMIVGGYPGCISKEHIDGYQVIRVGNRWSVYWKAFRYYRKALAGWADVVIEEINTIPFFTKFYLKSEKRLLFIPQLCREIWFYQMVFPLSLVGYLAEPLYLRLLKHEACLTISNSTLRDLIRSGFRPGNIRILPMGIELEAIDHKSQVEKPECFTVLSLGAMRSMKRTLHQISAFELAKRGIPDLKLRIVGGSDGRYGRRVMRKIASSAYHNDIEYLGQVDKDRKQQLLRESHVIAVTSVKEGWGLIVTEANSQGTPAVVYDVDGLRDSVVNDATGLITNENNPRGLADLIIKLYDNPALYNQLAKNSLSHSRNYSFEKCYEHFLLYLQEILQVQ